MKGVGIAANSAISQGMCPRGKLCIGFKQLVLAGSQEELNLNHKIVQLHPSGKPPVY